MAAKEDLFPPARPRPWSSLGQGRESYDRYETVSGAAGTGGVAVELGRFSGQPDAIDLVATGGDALVTLTDETGQEESTLYLVVNIPLETHIARRVVRAVNVNDGTPATVRATAKWSR